MIRVEQFLDRWYSFFIEKKIVKINIFLILALFIVSLVE